MNIGRPDRPEFATLEHALRYALALNQGATHIKQVSTSAPNLYWILRQADTPERAILFIGESYQAPHGPVWRIGEWEPCAALDDAQPIPAWMTEDRTNIDFVQAWTDGDTLCARIGHSDTDDRTYRGISRASYRRLLRWAEGYHCHKGSRRSGSFLAYPRLSRY